MSVRCAGPWHRRRHHRYPSVGGGVGSTSRADRALLDISGSMSEYYAMFCISECHTVPASASRCFVGHATDQCDAALLGSDRRGVASCSRRWWTGAAAPGRPSLQTSTNGGQAGAGEGADRCVDSDGM